MRKLQVSTLAVPLFIAAICTTFQNCDAGFHYDPDSGSLSSSSTTNDLTGVFGVVAYAPGGSSPLAQSTSFDTGFDYEIRATGATTSSALLTFAINPTSSTATCTLSSVGNTLKRSVKCTTAGVLKVDLKAIWPDSTISSVSITKNVVVFTPVATPAPNSGDVVQFRIVSGTGGSPWNSAAAPIQVFVGQTLTVFNDDSITHRIFANGAPFATQTAQIAPNSFTNVAITSAHSGTATDLYDPNTGVTSIVYINSIDGSAAYTKNMGGACSQCHGGSAATSAKRGASFTAIKLAIQNNSGNMGTITLSDQELRAIAYVLNK